MDNTTKEKLKLEIEHIARHQDLDKFNYNHEAFYYLGAVSIALSAISLTQFLPKDYFWTAFVILDIVFLAIVGLTISAVINGQRANRHFRIREKMIGKRLANFDISKDALEQEYLSTKL